MARLLSLHHSTLQALTRSLPSSQADSTPGSFAGLASWLRTSAHLTRPGQGPAEPPSPASGDASPSPGKGGRPVSAVLDFNAVEPRASTSPAAAAVAKPAAPASKPAAAAVPKPTPAPAVKLPAASKATKQAQPAKQAAPAAAAAPQPSAQLAKAAAVAAPAAVAAAPVAAVRQRPGATHSAGTAALRVLLLVCLLAGLLLAGPLALHAYAPALAQRSLPGESFGRQLVYSEGRGAACR